MERTPTARFTPAQVRRMVGTMVHGAGPSGDEPSVPWTRPELNGALIDAIDPVDAEDVARHVLREFAMPPVDLRSELSRVIASMPAPPRIVEFTAEQQRVGPRFGLPSIDDVGELASWLNVTIDELDWFADPGGWLRRASPRLQHYRVHRLPKRHGGIRVIEAPKERLATLQRRILTGLLTAVPVHPAAHGFVRGRSPRTFAGPHALHDTVIRIDLKHCFEHVGSARVRAVYVALGYRPAVARYLAELCTTSTAPADVPRDDPFHASLLRARHLPQGAPTSPALVNLALRRMDFRVAGVAAANDLDYTRYGDDLALSGNDVDVGRVLWTTSQIVADEGFAIHPDKVRVMGDHQRQQLAGLVVNVGPQSRRAEFDDLKALLHNAVRTGPTAQNRQRRNDFRAYVYGRIGWVSTGSATRRRKLLALAAQVDWDD